LAGWKSGGGPPQSKTLARMLAAHEPREASWSAPVLWHFERAGALSGRAGCEANSHFREEYFDWPLKRAN